MKRMQGCNECAAGSAAPACTYKKYTWDMQALSSHSYSNPCTTSILLISNEYNCEQQIKAGQLNAFISLNASIKCALLYCMFFLFPCLAPPLFVLVEHISFLTITAWALLITPWYICQNSLFCRHFSHCDHIRTRRKQRIPPLGNRVYQFVPSVCQYNRNIMVHRPFRLHDQ